jgi:outer membrane cobalamin receptor
MNLKNIFIIVVVLCLATPVIGQRPAMQNRNPVGVVEGYIFDKAANKPLEFASISLFRQKDSTLATGAITDNQGHYLIKEVPFGHYYIVADFIGYKKIQTNHVMIRPDKLRHDAGKIFLEPTAQNLSGVEITAEKNRLEYKIDRKVINVSQDINAQGGTAVDVLENTPSVEVDIEGNVSLRGSESFKVYIDGKPSVLEGNDLLKQLPANTIEQIEIITNPSVKYDPDGSGGIINVKMKKQKKRGFNGVLDASASTDGGYSSDFLFNYRSGNVNWFIGGDIRDQKRNGTGEIYRETYIGDTTYFYDSEKIRDRNRDGYSLKAGADISLSDKDQLGISLDGGNYGFGFGFDSEIQTYTEPVTETIYSFNINDFDRSGDYFRGTTNYLHRFNDRGHELSAMFYLSTSDDDELETQDDYLTNESYDIETGILNEKIKTTEKANELQYRFKLDYSLPLKNEGKMEAGVQLRVRDEESDYEFTYQDSENPGIWVTNPAFSSNFNFDRTIASSYATYGGSLGIFGFQAGMRMEYTDREIAKTTGESYVVNRWDWFPSIHTSLDFDDKHKLMVSYSKRIDRPRSWFLDPVISYRDIYNVRQGNPALEPEYSHSYELSFMKRYKGGFATIETYYRKTVNKISRLNSLYPENNEVLLMTFENLDQDEALGLELMTNTTVFKWWNLNISGTFYHYQVEDDEISQESNNWNLRFNNDFKITKNARLQLRGFYRGPSVTIQGEQDDFFYTSAAYRHDFFDKHLNVTVSVRDLLGTMKHQIITDQPGAYYTKQNFTMDPRVVRLSISYKINDFKNKRNGRDSSEPIENGEDMDF